MLAKIKETADFLKKEEFVSDVAIILGTGLGGLVNEIKIEKTIPYDKIPNFPVSTVEGHEGRLIKGKINDKTVLAMQGRFHYYEGYDMKEVTFPVRVFKFIGVKTLMVSNASGGLNPDFKVGDIMVLNDHINHFPEHPLRGRNYNELGPRFPDMSQVYDPELINTAFDIASKNNIQLKKGVYVGTSGPTFETPSEYMYFRKMGADAVGMSTVPEIIVAHHMSLRCFAISIITDSGVPGEIVEVSHEEVQHVAAAAEPKMTQIIKGLVDSL
ncbi:purine-nucleoside phosphorylase [Saccharicrinis sp. FJH62]|uniref:purine-nucleoside phosphorylase n=1 Tax=Saccharicrinis sp. FJH62 TaxID=3344657 RepID=UPI0035D4F092